MGTILVGAAVIVIAGMAARSIYRDKKAGKGCNGNCGTCKGCH
ncbi:MAG: FeoB-associated Cys-rich membrane protein [Lachnospiraceae bacterium]|nr:FeoB-associated Cys-rich membrane protein [Lachnospiraceae bacterium]